MTSFLFNVFLIAKMGGLLILVRLKPIGLTIWEQQNEFNGMVSQA
jgi:hypothetical protein